MIFDYHTFSSSFMFIMLAQMFGNVALICVLLITGLLITVLLVRGWGYFFAGSTLRMILLVILTMYTLVANLTFICCFLSISMGTGCDVYTGT